MSLVSGVLVKIKELAGKGVDFVKNLLGKLAALIPPGLLQKLPMPTRKGILIFIGIGAAAIILIICLIAALASMNRTSDAPAQEMNSLNSVSRPAIPPEEIFLPEEPDFIPGVIPEREQRDSWTAEDAEPFWYNPLEKGEERWRDRIESVIDELLEHVP